MSLYYVCIFILYVCFIHTYEYMFAYRQVFLIHHIIKQIYSFKTCIITSRYICTHPNNCLHTHTYKHTQTLHHLYMHIGLCSRIHTGPLSDSIMKNSRSCPNSSPRAACSNDLAEPRGRRVVPVHLTGEPDHMQTDYPYTYIYVCKLYTYCMPSACTTTFSYVNPKCRKYMLKL